PFRCNRCRGQRVHCREFRSSLTKSRLLSQRSAEGSRGDSIRRSRRRFPGSATSQLEFQTANLQPRILSLELSGQIGGMKGSELAEKGSAADGHVQHPFLNFERLRQGSPFRFRHGFPGPLQVVVPLLAGESAKGNQLR